MAWLPSQAKTAREIIESREAVPAGDSEDLSANHVQIGAVLLDW